MAAACAAAASGAARASGEQAELPPTGKEVLLGLAFLCAFVFFYVFLWFRISPKLFVS